MPNHVTQQLTIAGEEVAKVVDYIAGGGAAIDFERIIPMPKELDIESSPDGAMGLAAITGKCERFLALPWVTKLGIRRAEEFAEYLHRENPSAIELGQKYLSNQQRFGYATWYDWRQVHWGTKWNAYAVGKLELLGDRAIIRFNTAWSPAIPVITRLSNVFSAMTFTLRYFDEGWYFAGQARIEAGEVEDARCRPEADDPNTHFIYWEVYGKKLEHTTNEK